MFAWPAARKREVSEWGKMAGAASSAAAASLKGVPGRLGRASARSCWESAGRERESKRQRIRGFMEV
jgi:hypothetical protein